MPAATDGEKPGRRALRASTVPGADSRKPGANRSHSLIDFARSVEVRRSGLIFQRNLAFRIWEAIGQQILEVADSSTWWIGDWLIYGEMNFQDRYTEAIAMTALNYQTLRNYAWVARRFDLSRRQCGLSFGHHAEVAALDRPEQDFWLRKAVELGWSRNRLRSEVRASIKERQAGNPPPLREAVLDEDEGQSPLEVQSPGDQHAASIHLHLTSGQLLRFTVAAKSSGLEVHEWVIATLESAFKSHRTGSWVT